MLDGFDSSLGLREDLGVSIPFRHGPWVNTLWSRKKPNLSGRRDDKHPELEAELTSQAHPGPANLQLALRHLSGNV